MKACPHLALVLVEETVTFVPVTSCSCANPMPLTDLTNTHTHTHTFKKMFTEMPWIILKV